MVEYIKRTARCKDCLHFDICCEDWAYESKGKYTVDEYRAIMADKVPCANHFKPTADVVEVVRCKDCSVPHNKWTGCPNLNGLIPPPDFYCAKGEKIMRKNKIPKWWYAGFEKGFFHGCKCFVKIWWSSASNPLWDIKYWIKRRIYK